MNQNERKAHIQNYVQRSKEQLERMQKIEELYYEYVINKCDEVIDRLMQLIGEQCKYRIIKILLSKNCFSQELLSDIMQEGGEGICKRLKEDRNKGEIKENICGYAFNIYRHKIEDAGRKYYQDAKIYGCSLEELTEQTGEKIKNHNSSVYMEIDDDAREKSEVYGRAFRLYCEAMLNQPAKPTRGLSLYFARVLPHLWQTIPDTKGMSAKWAFEHIKGRTMQSLKDESEQTLLEELGKGFKWCDKFVQQMEAPATSLGQKCCFKDIVYTQFYDRTKMEKWAEDMHRVVSQETSKLIKKDSELQAEIKKYNLERYQYIQILLKGGKKKDDTSKG